MAWDLAPSQKKSYYQNHAINLENLWHRCITSSWIIMMIYHFFQNTFPLFDIKKITSKKLKLPLERQRGSNSCLLRLTFFLNQLMLGTL